MGRPSSGYRTPEGERVVGVTTVLSRFKESGGLMHWAWQQGRDGLDYKESRDKAADAGHCCHEMVECDIRNVAFKSDKYEPEIVTKAKPAFEAYLEWKKQTNLTAHKTELSLVHPELKFGGTLDAVLVQDRLTIGDWKTGSGSSLYVEYLLQLSAYKILYNYHFPHEQVTGFHLIKFSRAEDDEPVHFSHFYFSDLKLAEEQFLLLLQCYHNDKKIKKLTK
jgi:hypothetical protein